MKVFTALSSTFLFMAANLLTLALIFKAPIGATLVIALTVILAIIILIIGYQTDKIMEKI